MTISSLKFNRLFGGSLLAATVAGAIALLPQKASAIDLKFDNPMQTTDITAPGGFGNATQAYSGTVIDYLNVANGVDARITATVTGSNYSFFGHLPNYGNPSAEGDAGFLYQIDGGQTGLGEMTYKIELFESGTNFSTAYSAENLRFVVYDVDGQTSQGEALEIDKNSGLVGYQVSSSANPLLFTENTNSYLFSGRDANVGEDDTSNGGGSISIVNLLSTSNSPFSITNASIAQADYGGATILYFENTGSVTFKFKADTRSLDNSNPNLVFSAIDGDLSSIGGSVSANDWSPYVSVASSSSATAVPEPFTIIGSIIGGTAALRMRKKLKAKQ